MKVSFFQFYPFTIWTPGGGENQLRMTKNALENLGVETSFFDIWNPDRDFDILHVFGSSYQLSDFVVAAKNLNKKVIVSAIAYSTKPAFVWKIFKLVNKFLPFKTIYSLRRKIYDEADIVIAGSNAEAEQLINYFDVSQNKVRVIYNGAESSLLSATSDMFVKKYGLKDFILCVGRINDRKGQLRLIEAMIKENVDTVFIGEKDPSEPEYFERFLKRCEGNKLIHYLGAERDREMIASAYSASALHVLPSRGEFPGLVNLEAGMAGTRVVAGYSRSTFEHLGDDAYYCDPDSVISIRKAITIALLSPKRDDLKMTLSKKFIWEKISFDILKIYNELLIK